MQEDFERDFQTTESCDDSRPRSGIQCKEGDARGDLQGSRSRVPSTFIALAKALRIAALSIIRAYQMLVSPLLQPACRFTPTCSQYMFDAVERYGIFRGGYLGVRRLLRCHPFHHGGYDPVE